MSENHPVNNFPIMFDIARKYNNLNKCFKLFQNYLVIFRYKMFSFPNNKVCNNAKHCISGNRVNKMGIACNKYWHLLWGKLKTLDFSTHLP